MELNIKNILMAGIGTVAYTYEKGVELVEELVKKGELTVSQGKELNEELRKKLKVDGTARQADNVLTVDKFNEILLSLDLPTRQDLNELKERIVKLENK